jgi:hypothetical protein
MWTRPVAKLLKNLALIGYPFFILELIPRVPRSSRPHLEVLV